MRIHLCLPNLATPYGPASAPNPMPIPAIAKA